MKILEYLDLDTRKVKTAYKKVSEAIAKGDFRAAQVKKLSNLSHGKFYRARLDDSNRLLFSLWRHNDEVCALMLEVILNHDYDKSRFLAGCEIDESKIVDADFAEETAVLPTLRYVNPERTLVHMLDKPISFDDTQYTIYQQRAPLILVGSAGSGKTALTLEKLKLAEGEVLYVTHSPYLAQSARDLYYAQGFDHAGQEAQFLSYREFVETLHVPRGREASWRDFSAWFSRMRQSCKGIDAHQAFEEIRGVIAAGASGVLSHEAYLALGVRQSIFAPESRELVYGLFEKYRAWLLEAKLFDLNLVAQDWRQYAAPRYDFVVVDEVQDLTAAQLALVLSTLNKPGQFLLCGDSNQIVHPNFFSWSAVKQLFWHDSQLAQQQELRVLSANYRNGFEATRIANTLLKIKHKRFGSIDRESNFLVEAIGGETGQVALVADKDGVRRELDQKIRLSTQFAVLVMRDEDKIEARKHFATPLLFSIHEAKGLEYENIVLYRFISDNRSEFADIADGVTLADLQSDSLEYRRAKSKDDKSLEVYKFFINALYVALTRATKNLYLIEADLRHPLFDLLALSEAGQLHVEASKASAEDWQKEARKLELQGKQEQADAIRQTILKQVPPPWPVFDESKTRELLLKTFREAAPGNKHKQQLFEIAACQNLPVLAESLQQEGYRGGDFSQQRVITGRKSYLAYFQPRFKDILLQCDKHGIEHRLPMNQTPLMAAAAAGNVALVEALLERGANKEAVDHFGHNALHWAMRMAFDQPEFARGAFNALYDLLAPSHIDVNTSERLVRIDQHVAEYFMLQTLWTQFRHCFTQRGFSQAEAAFNVDMILNAWEAIPSNMIKPERKKRAYISSVLSRNEVDRDYRYNRSLFKRVRTGWYQLNPALSVRYANEEAWLAIYQALNLPLLNEFATEYVKGRTHLYLHWAGMGEPSTPIALEKRLAQQAAEREALSALKREREQRAMTARAVRTIKALPNTKAAPNTKPWQQDQRPNVVAPKQQQASNQLINTADKLQRSGRLSEAAQTLESGLRDGFKGEKFPAQLLAALYEALGKVRYLQNHYQDAAQNYKQAIDASVQAGDLGHAEQNYMHLAACEADFIQGSYFKNYYLAVAGQQRLPHSIRKDLIERGMQLYDSIS